MGDGSVLNRFTGAIVSSEKKQKKERERSFRKDLKKRKIEGEIEYECLSVEKNMKKRSKRVVCFTSVNHLKRAIIWTESK